jgi:hypothetical protein
MELHLKIIGILLLALACIHIIFPKYFNWKKELASLSLVNKQLMEVHTFFIAVFVFLNGLLCLFCYKDLMNTSLGRVICLGLAIFWGLRLGVQFFVYSPKLWKGKIFETIMHIVFSIIWIYITTIFILLYTQ